MKLTLARLALSWYRWLYHYHLRSAAVHMVKADIADWKARHAYGEVVFLELGGK